MTDYTYNDIEYMDRKLKKVVCAMKATNVLPKDFEYYTREEQKKATDSFVDKYCASPADNPR